MEVISLVQIRPVAEIARKWSEVTPGRQQFYASGVQNPKADWATEAQAGEAAWTAGVQGAITTKRFSSGVRAAGTEKWKAKASSVGPQRFAQGVSAAGPDFQSGFGPYADTIAAAQLPARGARGDPKNLERVRVLADALSRKRLAGGATR